MKINSPLKQSTLNWGLFGCILLNTLYAERANAVIDVGLLLGQANYTAVVKGDAIFAFGGLGQYRQYPVDINSKDVGAAILVRDMECLGDTFSLGGELGYLYLNHDNTVTRANNLFVGVPRVVETFTTKSNGVVLMNIVGRAAIADSVNFQIFGGPAWLSTSYSANDIQNGIVRSTGMKYQLTGDLGAEAEWVYNPNWSVSMRYDYIFNTSSRTVATTGSLGDALYFANTAESNLTVASLVLRYIIT